MKYLWLRRLKPKLSDEWLFGGFGVEEWEKFEFEGELVIIRVCLKFVQV